MSRIVTYTSGVLLVMNSNQGMWEKGKVWSMKLFVGVLQHVKGGYMQSCEWRYDHLYVNDQTVWSLYVIFRVNSYNANGKSNFKSIRWTGKISKQSYHSSWIQSKLHLCYVWCFKTPKEADTPSLCSFPISIFVVCPSPHQTKRLRKNEKEKEKKCRPVLADPLITTKMSPFRYTQICVFQSQINSWFALGQIFHQQICVWFHQQICVWPPKIDSPTDPTSG